MRAATSPAYLKGVGTRQALRGAATAGRERGWSSSSFRRHLPTEVRLPGGHLPTGTHSVVTWLQRTNHTQSFLHAPASERRHVTHNAPPLPRGCSAPRAACRGLRFPFISRSRELSGSAGSAAGVCYSKLSGVGGLYGKSC